MTQVQQASAAIAAPLSAQQKASVDYDSFLKLLVAQMRNQDPTQPTESAEYLAQLAAFSTVEQGIQTNIRLDALLSQSSVGMAGSLIGRNYDSASAQGVVTAVTITAAGLDLRLDSGATVRLGPGATLS
jgi:flagellar basal-body rod modification protein FlgD